jgi:superfamily II DNA or RNA helicase
MNSTRAFPFPGILELRENIIGSEHVFKKAMNLFISGMCTLTSRDSESFRFKVEDRFEDYDVEIDLCGEQILHRCACHFGERVCSHAAAALVYLSDKFEEETEAVSGEYEDEREGEIYTRDEMVRRVLKERLDRSAKEDFQFQVGDNIYGFHQVKTARNKVYNITIRDFKNSGGYCSCPDFKTNKLGTCKHLIFAANRIKQEFDITKRIAKQPFPFVEIFCDPLSDYHITYFYKGQPHPPLKALLDKYFKGNDYILPEQYHHFVRFLNEAKEFRKLLVRPEVEEKIEKYFESIELNRLSREIEPDFSQVKGTLFDYQKEGILFSLFKKGNIIADEMGLGKTFQAICTAVLKKDIYNLKRVLVVCPASLKYQWKNEIRKFSHLDAQIVEGPRKKRHEMYKNPGTFFLIANYEAILRDITIIKNHPPDMVILDEAQRIKNYDTKTSHAVKAIPRQHSLVITGTPIENRLIDLYSIMNFIDPQYLAPLWEFSMNHCRFDKTKKNKINGYYNLQALKQRLDEKIIRRVKADVLDQLPEVREMDVPIQLAQEQVEIHNGCARSVAPIMAKKHKTIYDMQRIFQLLTNMRMVCNSTYLIDKETYISPKLDALKEILTEKLDIKTTRKKLILFSEWKTMLHLIEKVLQSYDIGYVMLSGEVPVKDRGKLIREFEENPDCLVFLSTEAGGTGLNLQVADTVINFELPWNPAKKNQRIGRIHRLGQKSSSLTVINFVSIDSIEERIAAGIELKESLFEAVLNEGDATDEVDFNKRGRATMIQQIEKIISPLPSIEVVDGQEVIVEPEVFDLPHFPEDEEQELSLFDDEPPDFLEETVLPPKSETTTAAAALDAAPAATPIQRVPKPEEIESTLNQGLQFLNGIMSMATGKQLLTEEQSIKVNRETGEVVMKFKLPGF